ncbi:hypothetical protein [Streptomyces xanthophaeus]|uniref:hypothetical protein n=1 Tax=Streptomyces xanthophaeus TaxID=67385 RepID=UPI00068E464F|nr:hypothetical protein [Streptomyces xanthophaeus]
MAYTVGPAIERATVSAMSLAAFPGWNALISTSRPGTTAAMSSASRTSTLFQAMFLRFSSIRGVAG